MEGREKGGKQIEWKKIKEKSKEENLEWKTKEREREKKKKEETQNVQPFSILIFLLTPPKTSITASSDHDSSLSSW